MAVAVGWPAARMASRSTFSSGVPALTLVPSLTREVKPLPFISTVSMPTWIRSSMLSSLIRPTAWRLSGTCVTVPSNGAYTVSPVGSIPQPPPRIAEAKVSSGSSSSGMTLPSSGIMTVIFSPLNFVSAALPPNSLSKKPIVHFSFSFCAASQRDLHLNKDTIPRQKKQAIFCTKPMRSLALTAAPAAVRSPPSWWPSWSRSA